MRINLPQCDFSDCKKCFDGNCRSLDDFRSCEFAIDKSRLSAYVNSEDNKYMDEVEKILQMGVGRSNLENEKEILTKTLKKQIPMKVTDIHCDEYYCPACGAENLADAGNVYHKYCPECGQRLTVN